jgi:hypothetical protein
MTGPDLDSRSRKVTHSVLEHLFSLPILPTDTILIAAVLTLYGIPCPLVASYTFPYRS